MRLKTRTILLVTGMTIMFWGCPIGLDHSLGEPDKEAILPDLIGVWENTNAEAVVKVVSILQKDAFSYDVLVRERGLDYVLETDTLTGWVTDLNGMTFFYLRPSNEQQYYHYAILERSADQLVVCDMALLEGGTDAVTDRESLRKEVASSIGKPEFGSEKETWVRID